VTTIATTSPAVPIAPGRLPLIGHTLSFRKNPVFFLSSLRDFGEIVKIYLGPLPVYFVTSPGLVHRMLVTDSGSYDKGRLFDKLRSFVGNGLITSDGPFHMRQRRLIQPAFQHKLNALYADVMRAKTEEMVANWKPGMTIDLQRAFDELTLGVGVSALFSSELGKESVDIVRRCLPIVLRGVLGRTVLPDFVFRLPAPPVRRLNEAEHSLRGVVEDIIRAYRADGEDHGDVLTMLLAARDDDTGQIMTDEQVRDELITLMLAAAETTGGVLASLFFRLSQAPEVEAKLCAELDEILGRRPVEYDDIAAFQYLPHVLNEVLRMDMPSDMFMRRPTVDVTLGGVRLRAGTELMFSVPALHRDPAIYPEPHRFDPDRWARKPARSLPRGAFIPFGMGTRQCIGLSFAWTELSLVAAAVLSRWKVAIAPSARPVQVHRATTHFNDLMVTVEPRA
jgi:cytochrome P450